MATKKRQHRIAEFIQECVSELITLKLKDPRLARVTITHADITVDLREATIWFSVLGSDDDVREAAEGLQSANGWLRREVAGQLHLRFAPELAFKRDDSWERGARVDALLERIASQRAENDAAGPTENTDS